MVFTLKNFDTPPFDRSCSFLHTISALSLDSKRFTNISIDQVFTAAQQECMIEFLQFFSQECLDWYPKVAQENHALFIEHRKKQSKPWAKINIPAYAVAIVPSLFTDSKFKRDCSISQKNPYNPMWEINFSHTKSKRRKRKFKRDLPLSPFYQLCSPKSIFSQMWSQKRNSVPLHTKKFFINQMRSNDAQ